MLFFLFLLFSFDLSKKTDAILHFVSIQADRKFRFSRWWFVCWIAICFAVAGWHCSVHWLSRSVVQWVSEWVNRKSVLIVSQAKAICYIILFPSFDESWTAQRARNTNDLLMNDDGCVAVLAYTHLNSKCGFKYPMWECTETHLHSFHQFTKL